MSDPKSAKEAKKRGWRLYEPLKPSEYLPPPSSQSESESQSQSEPQSNSAPKAKKKKGWRLFGTGLLIPLLALVL